jgi:hypothetical protein
MNSCLTQSVLPCCLLLFLLLPAGAAPSTAITEVSLCTRAHSTHVTFYRHGSNHACARVSPAAGELHSVQLGSLPASQPELALSAVSGVGLDWCCLLPCVVHPWTGNRVWSPEEWAQLRPTGLNVGKLPLSSTAIWSPHPHEAEVYPASSQLTQPTNRQHAQLASQHTSRLLSAHFKSTFTAPQLYQPAWLHAASLCTVPTARTPRLQAWICSRLRTCIASCRCKPAVCQRLGSELALAAVSGWDSSGAAFCRALSTPDG